MYSTQTAPIPKGQDWLNWLMNALNLNGNPEGVCAGIVLAGTQSILAKDFKSYDQQFPHMVRVIKQIEQETKKTLKDYPPSYSELSETLRNEISTSGIIDFLKKVEIHFQPQMFPDLFPTGEKPFGQDAKKTFPITNPPILMKDKRSLICSAGLVSCFYTKEECEAVFKLLFLALAKFNKPVSISTISSNHAIGLGLVAEEKLKQSKPILIDANQLPSIALENANDAAQRIPAAFGNKNNLGATFSMEFYVIEDHLAEFNSILKELTEQPEWKKIHTPTTHKAKLLDAYNASWLHIAAKIGDEKTVTQLLQLGADPTQLTKPPHSMSPLGYAVTRGNLNVVKILLENKANPNEKDAKGFSLLHSAINNGHAHIVNALLTNPITNPNTVGPNNLSPLAFAYNKARPDIMKILLEKKADPNTVFSDKKSENDFVDHSLLYKAILKENTPVIELLLDCKGIDPNKGAIIKDQENLNKITPLQLALNRPTPNPQIIRLLLKHPDTIAFAPKESKIPSPFSLACQKKLFDIAQEIKIKQCENMLTESKTHAYLELKSRNNALEKLHQLVQERKPDISIQELEPIFLEFKKLDYFAKKSLNIISSITTTDQSILQLLADFKENIDAAYQTYAKSPNDIDLILSYLLQSTKSIQDQINVKYTIESNKFYFIGFGVFRPENPFKQIKEKFDTLVFQQAEALKLTTKKGS